MLTFTKNEIIDRIKEAIPEINKDITSYNFVEYNKYYAVQADGYEPILFEKEQGFPAFKNFVSVPEKDLGKGKVLEEVGKKTKYKKELKRFGTKGQKWGHRYHQSYETKPTRSGMVGEEHGDAARENKLLKEKFELDSLNYLDYDIDDDMRKDIIKEYNKNNKTKDLIDELKNVDDPEILEMVKINVADRLDDLNAEMAELDMFSEKDRKDIVNEYTSLQKEYNKINPEKDINKNRINISYSNISNYVKDDSVVARMDVRSDEINNYLTKDNISQNERFDLIREKSELDDVLSRRKAYDENDAEKIKIYEKFDNLMEEGKDYRNVNKDYYKKVDSVLEEYKEKIGDVPSEYRWNTLDKDKNRLLVQYFDDSNDSRIDLGVVYDLSGNESPTKEQKKTYNNLESIDFGRLGNTEKMEEYIKNDRSWSEDEIINQFDYFKPKNIYIPRDPELVNMEKGGFAWTCNYFFDEEHGIAIIFNKKGEVVNVVPEEEIL